METDGPETPPLDTERALGQTMRKMREDLGLTQQEVAERIAATGLRFHQTQIAKMERGERPIRVNEWVAIAGALGTTVQDMLNAAAAGPGAAALANSGSTIEEMEAELFLARDNMERAQEEFREAQTYLDRTKSVREAAEFEYRAAVQRASMLQVRFRSAVAVHDEMYRRFAKIKQGDPSVLPKRSTEPDAEQAGLDPRDVALFEEANALRYLTPYEQIGRSLAEARRGSGLTVEQLSKATRMRTHVIQAMESGNFGVCGGDVYARGYIRTFAKAVDFDPLQLIAEYDAARRAEEALEAE